MIAHKAPSRIAAAAVLSPLLHLAAWAALVAMPVIPAVDPRPVAPSRATATAMIIPLPPPEPEPAKPEKPDKPPDDDTVRLGIEKSANSTITWLGFEDPTPQSARKSEVEQAALARDVPPPAATEPKPQPAAGASTPTPAVSPPDAKKPEPPAPAKPAPESPRGEAPEAAKPAPPDEGGDMPAGPERADGVDNKPKADPIPAPRDAKPDEKPVKPAEAKPVPAEARPMGPESPDSDPAKPASASPPGPEQARDAEKSEKESDATSLTEPVDIHPGRPAAAQGLDITTRRPIFTTYTQITSWPSNPTLRVTFNRQGKVSNVVWVKRSGFESVDNPILTAVYAWTAKGKVLSTLPAPTKDKPEPGVTITVRIILR